MGEHLARPEPDNYQGAHVSEQQYAFARDVTHGVSTILISVELYRALPRGTVVQKMGGERHRKGYGILVYTPDCRMFEGGHLITDVGFPPRADDPSGIFMAGYRDS